MRTSFLIDGDYQEFEEIAISKSLSGIARDHFRNKM